LEIAGSNSGTEGALSLIHLRSAMAPSKHILREQGISKGSKVFSLDELWFAVEKKFPLDVLAQSCAQRHQIASAAASCSGGDDFAKERRGLHCSIRSCCMTVCADEGHPVGVKVVSFCKESDLEEEQTQILRCSPSEFLEEDWQAILAGMPPAEVECMFHCLPATSPVCKFVQNQFVANEMEAGVEEEEELNLSVVGI